MKHLETMRQITRTQRRRAEAAEAERDLFRDLLERIEQHPQLSPCPDLRAEIREAIG